MSLLLLGVGVAIVAASLYNAGVSVQALDARESSSDHALRASLLVKLAGERRWLLGTGLVTLGWTLQAGALLFAPLTVVQPALAVGLLLLLAIGTHVLHEPVGAREIAAVLAICGGLVGLALTAPEHTVTRGAPLAVALALAAIGLGAVVPYLLSTLGRAPRTSVVLSAGLAYAWCGITTKMVSDAVGAGAWGEALLWVLATATGAGVGLLSEMTALQSRPATRVAPVVLVVDIVVAVAFAAALVGERWSVTPSGGAILVGALALVTAAAGVLAASPAVAAATHPTTTPAGH